MMFRLLFLTSFIIAAPTIEGFHGTGDLVSRGSAANGRSLSGQEAQLYSESVLDDMSDVDERRYASQEDESLQEEIPRVDKSVVGRPDGPRASTRSFLDAANSYDDAPEPFVHPPLDFPISSGNQRPSDDVPRGPPPLSEWHQAEELPEGAPDHDLNPDADLSPQPDLSPEPDLSPVPDLRPEPDLSPEPDLNPGMPSTNPPDVLPTPRLSSEIGLQQPNATVAAPVASGDNGNATAPMPVTHIPGVMLSDADNATVTSVVPGELSVTEEMSPLPPSNVTPATNESSNDTLQKLYGDADGVNGSQVPPAANLTPAPQAFAASGLAPAKDKGDVVLVVCVVLLCAVIISVATLTACLATKRSGKKNLDKNEPNASNQAKDGTDTAIPQP